MSIAGDDWHQAHNDPLSNANAPSPWVFAYVATALVVFAVFKTLTADDMLAAVTTEAGPVEAISALLWGLAAVTILSFSSYAQLGYRWPLVAGFALLGARELDWDKAFLSEGILQLRLYSGDAPLSEKLIGGLVLVLILTVIWKVLRAAPAFVHALWVQRAGWAWMVIGAGVLAVVAKTIDGIDRKLADFGVTVPAELVVQLSVLEELMELVFVLAMIFALCMFEARSRVTRP